jgi:AraC-like DNA-binding protein
VSTTESGSSSRSAARSTEVELTVSTGVTLLHHDCDRSGGEWSPAEVLDRHGLVFVRRGGFHRRLDGREAFAGPAMAYFEMSGTEMQVAHRGADGDETSVYFLDDDAVSRLCGGGELPDSPIVIGGAIDVTQRRLAAAAETRTDELELEERMTQLVASVIESITPGRVTTRRRDTELAHGRIAIYVSEAVCADPVAADLATLAADLAHSPFHVSRVFREQTGLTLTRFRNKVRASIAIDRLAQGEADLAGLAVELGFHDQAHMTRVVRAEAALPPGRIRSLLADRAA